MRKILLILSVLLISCQKQVQKELPVNAPEGFEQIRNEIIQIVKNGKTPSFSIAVLQNGKILWQEAFEQLDDTSSVSISSDAQFPLASLTKSMSATVLLKLVDETITESGIILKDVDQKPNKGRIVKVGEKVGYDLKEGDLVMFDENAGKSFNHEGEDLWLIIQDSIYGIIQ